MNTMILRVKKCGAMTTVQSEKSENGVLNKQRCAEQAHVSVTRTWR